ncbi:MAG: CHAD domain-containing protein [Planctomycetes bacterium]|nr:CHAD domain-containing protein [Planctomycetota bacterium]
MIANGKWIDGIGADDSVANAARRSLEARLTAVARALPLAAHLAEHDVEHVHRLRVSTRRAMAALKLYRDWLPRKRAQWLKKRLKKVRRAAGDARDLDVLAERLARDYGERAAPVVAMIVERRKAVQPAIVAIAQRCRRGDRFVRKTGKLLAKIEAPRRENCQPVTFRGWAVERLSASAERFFAALPDESADTAALHQFRIRAKALRYTIELVAAAFGAELRNEQYPIVEELQERLGTVQDHVTAIARLSDWVDATDDDEQKTLLFELADEERSRLADAVIDFRQWWTGERVDVLRAGVAQSQSAAADETTSGPQVAHQT